LAGISFSEECLYFCLRVCDNGCIEAERYIMTDAIILPFPSRPNAEQERLKAALASLQSALDEQRRALSDWRFAMSELGIGVAGLGHALTSYQDALGGVGAQLAVTRQKTARLENWADAVLAAEALQSSPVPDRGEG
jgi:hypothetical protein